MMKNKNALIGIMTVFLLVFTSDAYGQFFSNNKKLSIDIYGGTTMMHGDIKNEFGGMAGNLGLRYAINEVFSVQGLFTYGQLQGADENGRERYFTNNFNQVTARLNANFLSMFELSDITDHFLPYTFIGIGMMNSNVVDINEKTEGSLAGMYYNGSDFAFQTGIGAKLYLSKSFDLNFQVDMNFLASDWIDGHNPGVMANKHDDSYSTVNLGVTYKFGSGRQHLDWSNRWY